MSLSDSRLVSYYQTVIKWARGLRTPIKPGAYLNKHHPHLTGAEVKEWAEKHAEMVERLTPRTAFICRTADEIVTAINLGPSESCQSAGFSSRDGDESWFAGHAHPAICYAHPSIQVIYITDNNRPANADAVRDDAQRIIARTIANSMTKKYARIYGDATRMTPVLEAAGYAPEVRALVGCSLLRIENKKGKGYLMPYVDAGIVPGGGCLAVRCSDDGETWLLDEAKRRGGSLSTYAGFENKGVLAITWECPNCGARHAADDEDARHSSNHHGVEFCTDCEDSFTFAVTISRRTGAAAFDYILNEYVIQVDGEYYHDSSEVRMHFGIELCEHCGDYSHARHGGYYVFEGFVCEGCEHTLVDLAECDPDGNMVGMRATCDKYVDRDGHFVWLHEDSDPSEYTEADGGPRYFYNFDARSRWLVDNQQETDETDETDETETPLAA